MTNSISNSANAIIFEVSAFNADMSKLRENGVSVANKTVDVARHALAGLLSGEATVKTLTIATLALHGNPKSPKGKIAETINGLQYVKGGEAARNCLKKVFDIFDNLESAPSVRDIVESFILDKADAPKGLEPLRKAVNDAIKAYILESQPEVAEGEGEAEADNEADNAADSVTAGITAAMVKAMADGIGDLHIDALGNADMQHALGALYIAIAKANVRIEAVNQKTAKAA